MVVSFAFTWYALAATNAMVSIAQVHAEVGADVVVTTMGREEAVVQHSDAMFLIDDGKSAVRRATLEPTGLSRLEVKADPVRRVNARRKKDVISSVGSSYHGDSGQRRRHQRKTTRPLGYSKFEDTEAHQTKPCTGHANCCLIPDAPYGTACPHSAEWVSAMVAADPRPGKVVMSIGCNKGNDAISWMDRWDLSENHVWSTGKWIEHHKKKHVLKEHTGYSCPPSVPARQNTAYAYRKKLTASETRELPIGICVEPMPANVRLLRNTSAQLGYNKVKRRFGSFLIVHAAVTRSASKGTATADFPDNPTGAETAKLWIPSMRGPKTTVPLTTVDAIVAAQGLNRVDVLTIDTEGADADVLKGAESTLKSVRYLEFEVHRDLSGTAWNRTTLASVVGDLHDKGFDCFWAGTNGKLVNMRACWREDFERGHWGNAACVKRADQWGAILQRFATA